VSDAALLAALADAYGRDGFAVLPGAVGADRVAEVRHACEGVWSCVHDHSQRTFARRTLSGASTIDRVDPVADLDDRIGALAADPIVLEPVVALIGTPVSLLKSKLIWKGPGVDGYGAHQDHAYYRHVGVDAGRCVSVLVPLDPFARAAGPLEVAPGSHHGLLPTLAGTEDPEPDHLVGATWAIPRQDPGDLGFLHPLALHRSAPNRSRQRRRILFLTFVAGSGCDAMAGRLEALYRDRFKAAIDEGASAELTPPAQTAPPGDRSPR
jgi:ectoine hydroxylase-related dioxygenase (phytanoyl-CoA dioxygenase family)